MLFKFYTIYGEAKNVYQNLANCRSSSAVLDYIRLVMLSKTRVNPLPYNKFLGLSKLKAFADNKINLT